MINIKDLTLNKEKYIEGFKNKKYDLATEVEKVIELNSEITKLLSQETEVRAELNKASKEISSNPSDENLKAEATKLSSEAKAITTKISKLKEEMEAIASYFPQVPSSEVPVGTDEADNKVMEEFGKITSTNKTPH